MKHIGHTANGVVVAMTAEMIALISRGARPGDKYRSITPEKPKERGPLIASSHMLAGDPKHLRRKRVHV